MTDSPAELVTGAGPVGFDAYQAFALNTDRSGLQGEERFKFLLLGLFGEVGSLLSELKKKQRDKTAYFAYAHSAQEETGDVLWYLANVATALNLSLSALAARAFPDAVGYGQQNFASLQRQDTLFQEPASGASVHNSLLSLAARTGRLVRRATDPEATPSENAADLVRIFQALVSAAGDAHISLDRAVRGNISKILDRWPLQRIHTPLFDEGFDRDEKLPRRLEVEFREKAVGGTQYVFQTVHGIHLGDRLTDNSADQDDYRFHDVFHLAYAAILGWSPVLRALLRLKRKSDRVLDEHQDGARAIITEEGISNWIFAHGLRHRAFEEVDSLDFQLLKTIRQRVKGYEVEACPLWMWEEAILQGFTVFRQLKAQRGGVVIADLELRTLSFRGLSL